MNTVFLFPGQGSQEIGMGQDLFKDDAFFRSLITLASDMTHEDLEKLCLRGPDKRLRLARFLQPLLTAVSLGYHARLRNAGIVPSLVLGHSLGEITALAGCGIVTDEQAVTIAAKRGELMDEAASHVNGGMLAVLFASLDAVTELLIEMNMPKRIVVANDNADSQIVLSGDMEALDEFARRASESKIGKCKAVMVSGPWHSPFMAEARDRFREWVASMTFSAPKIPLMLNATATTENDPELIRTYITEQLVAPVHWRKCMQAVNARGETMFLEIGPQRILSGLVRVNNFPKTTVVYNINNLVGCERAVSELSS